MDLSPDFQSAMMIIKIAMILQIRSIYRRIFFDLIDVNFLTDGKKHLIVKSSFSIQNYQPHLENMNNVRGLYDDRLWSTPAYEDYFFNDFIKSSLKNDIKKRIIINGITGSSWRFNRFQFVSVTFNTKTNQKILRH